MRIDVKVAWSKPIHNRFSINGFVVAYISCHHIACELMSVEFYLVARNYLAVKEVVVEVTLKNPCDNMRK